jgi:hypothetical protein
LAFDPVSQQIFVTDRATGLIHRLGLDGTDRGSYDHGAQGLPNAGLPPVPPDPAVPIDITSPAFDTGNPSTWGFASPQRRVFAVAAHSSRLFYSVAQPQQVWSVGIAPDGSFIADTRLEVDVPPLLDGSEISSIAFDAHGLLYIAERGPTTGDYTLVDLATGGQSRVLRFHPKQPGDPAPGFWSASPDQYAIGLPPQYNNANGGVALGYGYRTDGQIDRGSCSTTVWSTGERLLDPGASGLVSDRGWIAGQHYKSNRTPKHAASWWLVHRLLRPAEQPGQSGLYGRRRRSAMPGRQFPAIASTTAAAAPGLPAWDRVLRRSVSHYGVLPAGHSV